MKNKIIALFVLVSLVSVGNAFAALIPTDNTPKITVNGSSVNKSYFEWTETPYAFIQFLDSDISPAAKREVRTLDLDWTWTYLGSGPALTPISEQLHGILIPMDNEYYNNWNMLDSWETLRIDRTGEWSVTTRWSALSGGGSISRSFTLNGPNAVPEPLSSMLFLTGGLMFAARKLRGKKAA